MLYLATTFMNNFGDMPLNKYLFEKISGQKPELVEIKSLTENDIDKKYDNDDIYLFCGSTLSIARKNMIVYGTGLIDEKMILKETPKKICAVRGPKTKKRLTEMGIDCPDVYGDAAMLLPKFYTPRKSPTYALGIIPHYVNSLPYYFEMTKFSIQNRFPLWTELTEYEMQKLSDITMEFDKTPPTDFIPPLHPFLKKITKERINLIQQNKVPKVLIIDVNTSVEKFIDNMAKCERIASDSLHGLITASAYNIPFTWIKFSDKIYGNDFKFYDFFESINISMKPIVITENTSWESLYNSCYCGIVNFDMDKFYNECPFKK